MKTPEETPVFTPAHVEYLARVFPDRVNPATSYTLEDIHRIQGSIAVVAHVRALVTKQAKEKGHVPRT